MDIPPLSISLTVKDGNTALQFYQKAFDAEETLKMEDPQGGVAHAEFMLAGNKVYLSEAAEEWQAFPMAPDTMASCLFTITTKDCDGAFHQAVEAGAKSLSAPEDQFWGGRSCVILDPFGYRWSFVQIIEVLSNEEVAARAAQFFEAS